MKQQSKKKGGKPLKFSVEKMLKAIDNSAGIKSEVAKRLNCSRSLIYEYIERFPEVRAAFEDEEEKVLDMAESSLFSLIQDGDTSAIFYYLNNKGKKRGYAAPAKYMPNIKDEGEKEKTGVLVTPGILDDETWEKLAATKTQAQDKLDGTNASD